MSERTMYAVKGTAFGDGKPMLIRRHETHEAAAAHALKLDMTKWDDVWVESVVVDTPTPNTGGCPPFPWNVLWVGGYAYVTDATGRKIMSLLGSQAQREYVAEVVIKTTALAGGVTR